ncbi:cytochrome c oxidase accessory protein CcoG [Vineibacter terrae]|uniref:cytochrome c oxidase accessory protein CcoG n=1 Tax=Vineibacter terrae TaxID=2586908 RepID=UPI002E31C093|nr:cytochrome c oxidase accessory protein CcoG [Vineibacter terrae]HEX2886458.1 cytochrome c oxidase accessory protein CcoG [Vineibacter terrae]
MVAMPERRDLEPAATDPQPVTTPAPLYASRVRVYPRKVSGTWRSVKWVVLAACLTIYYAAAWLRWDRGPNAPDQAFLVDIVGRRAYFLDLEIWPQEVYYITGLLILGAVGLFLATSLFGRVWCGYSCPQTVWTDLFMLVERWIEGDRNARIRLDKGRMTTRKAALKTTKHAAWLLIAFATGGAWILYFNDAPTVTRAFFTGEAGAGVYFFVALFTATTYMLAGWAREQVCTYMCPWPRFQAAMFDEHSFTVTYRAWRGEPRGAKRKTQSWEGRGDCIDCKACVQVCPTGIDIRNGPQLECISCGLCVDACNEMMDRIDRPRGLIDWTTLAADAAAARREKPAYRIVRSRTLIYAALLVVVAAVMVTALALRSTVEVNVLRDRNPQFVTLADGSIRNGYTIKILNKTRSAATFRIRLEGPAGATMALSGGPAAETVEVTVGPDSVGSFPLFVRAARGALTEKFQAVRFNIIDPAGDVAARRSSVFAGPG